MPTSATSNGYDRRVSSEKEEKGTKKMKELPHIVSHITAISVLQLDW